MENTNNDKEQSLSKDLPLTTDKQIEPKEDKLQPQNKETLKQRSFKEGLANNSDTENK